MSKEEAIEVMKIAMKDESDDSDTESTLSGSSPDHDAEDFVNFITSRK